MTSTQVIVHFKKVHVARARTGEGAHTSLHLTFVVVADGHEPIVATALVKTSADDNPYIEVWPPKRSDGKRYGGPWNSAEFNKCAEKIARSALRGTIGTPGSRLSMDLGDLAVSIKDTTFDIAESVTFEGTVLSDSAGGW